MSTVFLDFFEHFFSAPKTCISNGWNSLLRAADGTKLPEKSTLLAVGNDVWISADSLERQSSDQPDPEATLLRADQENGAPLAWYMSASHV